MTMVKNKRDSKIDAATKYVAAWNNWKKMVRIHGDASVQATEAWQILKIAEANYKDVIHGSISEKASASS